MEIEFGVGVGGEGAQSALSMPLVRRNDQQGGHKWSRGGSRAIGQILVLLEVRGLFLCRPVVGDCQQHSKVVNIFYRTEMIGLRHLNYAILE